MGAVGAICCTEESQPEGQPVPHIPEKPVFATSEATSSGDARGVQACGDATALPSLFGSLAQPLGQARVDQQDADRRDRGREFHLEIMKGRHARLMRQVGAKDVEIVPATLHLDTETNVMFVRINEITVKWAANGVLKVLSVIRDGTAGFPVRVFAAVNPDRAGFLVRLDTLSFANRQQTLFFLEETLERHDQLVDGLMYISQLASSGMSV